MIKLILIFSSILAICSAACNKLLDEGLTTKDVDAALKKHNECRSLIAHGQIAGQPKATNLLNLTWDDSLAAAAQKVALTCEFAHVKINDTRWYVGQNLYWSGSTANSGGEDWVGAVQAWFDEYKSFQYPDKSTDTTGHYTQVVWADTKYVGCGFTYYLVDTDTYKYQKLYVCNYGPGGNYVGEAPYKIS